MKEIVLKDNNSSANNDTADEKIDFLLLRSLTLEHLETIDDFFSSTNSRSKQKCHGLEPYVSAPFFNAQVAFPKLDTLKLSSLLNLNKIWDGNYDSMHNLTSLIVDNCGGLKYLFSSTVVGSFKNLKHLEISNCAMMEEIIAKEEENNALEEVHFLKLEKIIVKDMDNLKTIWHHQFETVKMLQVNNCDKIVVVFPSSMQKTYNKLEMLEVTNCALVEEIFELSFNEESSSVEDTTHLKEVTIDGLDKLKKIWSRDPQGILCFQNLSIVKVKSCQGLEYLLPLSIATRCSHLKELRIDDCEIMKEIVAEEKESSVNAAPIFEFNQLSTLLLRNLHIKGFFAKKHTLAYPSLKMIDVLNCPKLTLYRTLSTSSSNIRDDEFSVSTQQPLFIVEENEDTFPYWFLQNVRGLKKLVIGSSCFKKIFQDEGQIREKTQAQLKKLTLFALPNLEHICEEGFQIDPVLEDKKLQWANKINYISYGAKFEQAHNTEGYLSTPNLRKVKIAENDEQWFWKGNLNDTMKNMFEDKVAFGKFKYLALSDYPEMKDLCAMWIGRTGSNRL
ncbi:hypothetical protein TSUD_410500 [Trifolium subterraneum]|uniref:Disease resistance protein At4g27190-like leucine-rich repeats domain-containing protein n=1 Tax=Trifolium subterraneum TaxID=3900 RepID=A0A2Z6P2R9_TRISU|nr:hypothetical protein TSUD_410500 [Trifolium subterraneum]